MANERWEERKKLLLAKTEKENKRQDRMRNFIRGFASKEDLIAYLERMKTSEKPVYRLTQEEAIRQFNLLKGKNVKKG